MMKISKFYPKMTCLCLALLFLLGNICTVGYAGASAAISDNAAISKGVSDKPDPQRHAEALVQKALSYKSKSQSTMGFKIAWCALFVGRCAKESGVPDSVVPNNISTVTTFHETMLKKGLKAYTVSDLKSGTYKPEVGDLVFSDTYKKLGHIGIVCSVNEDGSFQTIDGNVTGMDGVSRVSVMYLDNEGTFIYSSTKVNSFIRPNYSEIDK